MKKRVFSKLFITFTVVLSLLSGCGQKTVEVPELMEPIAVRESFRPVGYSDVGKIDVVYGEVVPEDSCYFWSTATIMKSLDVTIGDYVEAGTVLASADTDATHEELERLQREIEYQKDLFALNEEKYRYQHEELEYISAATWVAGQTEQTEQISKQILTLEENHSYDVLTHEFQMDQLNEQNTELKDLLEHEVLVAKQSGYVSYIKDLTKNKFAQPLENIVIISNFDHGHIEIPSFNMAKFSRNKLQAYSKYYTVIHQKRCDLEEYQYTAEEQVIMENRSLYPNLRMVFSDDSAVLPEIGTTLPIFMVADASENVLCVGNDSLYQDSVGDYVYVKDDDKKVPRYVELGKKGDEYTEILSGLEEGELVSYSVTTSIPDDYKIVETKLGDFSPTSSSKSYTPSSSLLSSCNSEYEGTVVAINVHEKGTVEKGDLICRIETDMGAAKLAEIAEGQRVLQENYDLQTSSFADMRNGIYSQSQMLAAQYNGEMLPIKELLQSGKDEKGNLLTKTRIQSMSKMIADKDSYYGFLHKQLESKQSQIDCQEKCAELTYQYSKKEMEIAKNKANKNNDGNGVISIYADTDGVIYSMQLEKNQTVKRGDMLFCIITKEKTMIVYATSETLRINQEVKFDDEKNNVHITGKVIGIADGSRAFLSKIDKDTYLTTCYVETQKPLYYISISDPEFFHMGKALEMEYSGYDIRDTVVIPKGLIHTENVENKEHCYVWKVKDGILIKQYVLSVTPPGNSNLKNECILRGLEPGDELAK